MSDAKQTSSGAPKAISGIDVMRGVGAQQAKGFWADAWERVLQRKGAVFGIAWISVVAFFAIFAPVLASAHPVYLERLDAAGAVTAVEWPLVANLTPTDWLLMIGFAVGVPWTFLGPKSLGRSGRLGVLVVALLQAGLTIVLAGSIAKWADSSSVEWLKQAARLPSGPWPIVGAVAAVVGLLALIVPTFDARGPRIATVAGTALLAATLLLMSGGQKLINFERYIDDERAGKIRAVWTPVPWSPQYTRSDMSAIAPGTAVAENPKLAEFAGTNFGERRNLLGTDALGGDVLAQMMWACRLSISIGLVSTGISLLIGVTIGAIMGYFGGWIDLFLFRIVEIFMAVPVLFLLIVAAGVLPRDTYVMMAIIGCFSWTGAARFTRAEFLKLRKQDFVQAAQATGLPLRAILFRHMLPNGVTPVLVDASFAIAAAISVEATLSFLGLGPDGQASWGKLLSSATASTGTFVWWLAVFPGLAIFLSVLSYNLLGEALRDAIDPKLRKAAH
jgi:peptide/nickel transport system permease protein